MDKSTMRIPVTALMRRQPDGSYEIVPEESEYIDITPDEFARFLIRKFGLEAILKGRED